MGGAQWPIIAQRRLNRWHMFLSEGGDDSAISQLMFDDFFGAEEFAASPATPTVTYVPTGGMILRPFEKQKRYVRRRRADLEEWAIVVEPWPALEVGEVPRADLAGGGKAVDAAATRVRIDAMGPQRGLTAIIVNPGEALREARRRAEDADDELALMHILRSTGDL